MISGRWVWNIRIFTLIHTPIHSLISFAFGPGVAVLEMDDNFNAITTRYRSICSEWFDGNSLSEKEKFVAESKDPLFKELGRRPNIGYILTEHKKEYLKFKDSSAEDMFPSADIHSRFKALFREWNDAALLCMDTVLSEPVASSKNTNGTPSNEEDEEKLPEGMEAMTTLEDRSNIRKFAGIHSSISLIHYFDKKGEKADEHKMNDKDRRTNRTVEVPLGKHVDTGLMTLITCSDVVGLEVLDRKTNRYYYPEQTFDPKKHIFVIAGRKMELFTHKKVVKSTWHQVRIPLEKERNSLLYFMEIQKDH